MKNAQEMAKAVKSLKGYTALLADIKSGKVQRTASDKEFYELLLSRVRSKTDKALVEAYLASFTEDKVKKPFRRKRRATAVGSKTPKVSAPTPKVFKPSPKVKSDLDLRSKIEALLCLRGTILTDSLILEAIAKLV